MAAGVWSGERVVVFLVIIQVLSSIVSSSLLWEAMALVLLAVGALLVEIFVDGSEFTRFQTRRGASSGILLGTVSIPLVLLSRLIQLSSGLTSQEVGSEGAISLESELGYLNIQYWSVSVGGLVVLIFLSSLLSNQKGNKKLWDLQSVPFGVFYFLLYATFWCLSLASSSHNRYSIVGKASWIFVHGLAAVGLVKHILLTFSLCASIGEAMLAASGLVLYLSDALLHTVVKANSLSSSFFLQYGTRRSQVSVIIQPEFLDLAFGVALAVFLMVETIRVWRIWPCGDLVHKFMNAFTDHRDSDLLIVSHFSLLLGCALPKWLSSGFNNRPLAPFAGILSLGIGDTMASMVGHKYGVLRWSKAGKKTIEGTAAGITSVLLACSVLLPLLASTGYFLSQHWLSLVIAVSLSGLLEAYTAQLDNAFIPLVFYSLLCVT